MYPVYIFSTNVYPQHWIFIINILNLYQLNIGKNVFCLYLLKDIRLSNFASSCTGGVSLAVRTPPAMWMAALCRVR